MSQRVVSPLDSSQNCLCLFCRQTGHIVETCPRYIQQRDSESILPQGEPTPTPTPPPLDPLATSEDIHGLCQRCSQLDGLIKVAAFRPFVEDDLEDNHTKRATKKTTQLPGLGPILSLRLLSTCPLCRFLFNVSYVGDEHVGNVEIGGALVPILAWTIHRFEGELAWEEYYRGKGPYAKCVYTSVRQDEEGVCAPADLVEDAADAFGIVDIGQGPSNDVPALGVRRVDPKRPDYDAIKGWLERCDSLHHITCRPLVSDSLKQIRLVDVETRQVIMYPADGCAYVALSYVWGNVQQANYKAGDVLPTVPATLEDAMVVVRNLGKRYLWADSLCIDQGNEEEKTVQIALMSAIYSGAWATIVCLSSLSAGSGIPRVGTLEGVVPQLSCDVWGKQLLSMMPTLSQQISRSPWASRAWTYQEGLLSPRRLFFTNHQVYFECNSVQCCESLNDSNSPFHLLSDREKLATIHEAVSNPDEFRDAGAENFIGRGVLRDPFRPISAAEEAQVDEDHFATYTKLVHPYTMKKMSRDADSLNAFSAVLIRLEGHCYKEGFVQGMPVEDLPRALLWFHPAPPRRRSDFPAWSWAGWEGPVDRDGICGAKEPTMMPPLRVWKPGRDEPIYNFNPKPHIIEFEKAPKNADDDDDDDDPDHIPSEDMDHHSDSGYESDDVDEEPTDEEPLKEIKFEKDPVFRISKEEVPWVLSKVDRDELRIEGIVIRLSFVETPEDDPGDSDGETDDEYDGRCSVLLEGHPRAQQLRFYGHNAAQLANQRSGKQQEFLLVFREDGEPKIEHALLLIDREADVAQRVGVASLTLDSVELLDRLNPERRMFKLG